MSPKTPIPLYIVNMALVPHPNHIVILLAQGSQANIDLLTWHDIQTFRDYLPETEGKRLNSSLRTLLLFGLVTPPVFCVES